MIHHQITLHPPADTVSILQQQQQKNTFFTHRNSKMFQQYSFKNVILLLEASESLGLSTVLNIINRPAGINI